MKLTSTGFADNQKIPGEFAFCIPDPAHHVCLGSNRNPPLAWNDAPAGTKSFAIICHDPDVPSKGDDVNQEGRSVPASLPRVDFFHWVLVDLPASKTAPSCVPMAAAWTNCRVKSLAHQLKIRRRGEAHSDRENPSVVSRQ